MQRRELGRMLPQVDERPGKIAAAGAQGETLHQAQHRYHASAHHASLQGHRVGERQVCVEWVGSLGAAADWFTCTGCAGSPCVDAIQVDASPIHCIAPALSPGGAWACSR